MRGINVYQRRSKNGAMEKNKETGQPEVPNNWIPETPAPTRPLKVYTKRCRKVGALTSIDKSHEQKDQKSLSMETSCLVSDGSKETIGDRKDAGIGLPAGFVVNSSEYSGVGDFNLEETFNSLGDKKACTVNHVARRLDFFAFGKGLGDPIVPLDSIPSTDPLSYARVAPPCIGATTLSKDQSSSHYDGQKDGQGDFISPVKNEFCLGVCLEPATPLLKQNFNKRSRNGTDVNQRPLKRTKIKKHRHRPKVAGTGRKRKVKSPPEEKKKRKTVRKNDESKEREKRMKTSTIEHHTGEVVEPVLFFPKVCKQKRIKRQRKSKVTILLRFLDLHGHPKKKRCKVSLRIPDASLGQPQIGLAGPVRGVDGPALGIMQPQISCPLVPQLSAPPMSYSLPVIRPPGQMGFPGQGRPRELQGLPPPQFGVRPPHGQGFRMPHLPQQFGQWFSGMSLHLQGVPPLKMRGPPAPRRPRMLPPCPNMLPPPLNPQQHNGQQYLLDVIIRKFELLKIFHLGAIDLYQDLLSTEVRGLSAIVPYEDLLSTKLGGSSAIVPYHDLLSTTLGGSSSIVPYEDVVSTKVQDLLFTKVGGSRAMVPHRSAKGKREKPKVEVLLDKETLRQWNLLMKIDDGMGEEKEDKERDKKWEEELEIFYGRIKSFTSRMHMILGDRRFKPWKGSVVDSMVGVFLTQNVTDFLSSAAYMTLASRFPVQSTSSQDEAFDELDYKNSQESIGDSITCHRTKTLHGNGYFVTELEPKTPVDIIEEISLVDVEDIGNTISAQQSISEMPYSSPSACCNDNNSHLMEDYQAENVIEGKVSLDMCFLSQDCSSRVEVGVESNLHSQIVINDNEVVLQESALDLIAVATSMTNQRSGLAPKGTKKAARGTKKALEKDKSYWNTLATQYSRPRGSGETDSVDWEAVRQAPVTEIADAIKSRGQHNIMAYKIKKTLNRIVDYHGSIDLEWLRHAPDNYVKEYLLEIEGLGLKSVECLRLLTLYHDAFPVDTNVARIAVRLGWVPLEPLPGDLQLHLLEEYPVMDTIQKYLWPRLCKLDQKALYELHYHMITFGKVFCTKRSPNCGVCPMRAECRHLASAIASENLCLPGLQKRGEERSKVPSISLESSTLVENNALIVHPTTVPISEFVKTSELNYRAQTCEPLIEEPKSPELVADMEDFEIEYAIDEDIINDDEEIPTIVLSNEPFRENVQYFMDMYQNNLQTDSSSRALVPISVNVDSVPMRKLKNISRLRTEHQVYEIPDDHELLIGLPKRDRNDQSPYLLAIWTPGESPASCQPPKKTCNSQGPEICKDLTCFSCQAIWEEKTETIRGTILVPCRTAMRGRFPLNGTYFQVNEVFADHESSYNPIIVPRSSIWYLRRRTIYFGTSPNSIFKACSLKDIQETFWKGFMCVKGWDAKTGAPKPLAKRFHCSPSKMEKTRKKANQGSKDVKGTANMSMV